MSSCSPTASARVAGSLLQRRCKMIPIAESVLMSESLCRNQVSSAQLGSLARLAAGQLASPSTTEGGASSSGAEFNGAGTSVADGTGRFGDLTLEEFRCAVLLPNSDSAELMFMQPGDTTQPAGRAQPVFLLCLCEGQTRLFIHFIKVLIKLGEMSRHLSKNLPPRFFSERPHAHGP